MRKTFGALKLRVGRLAGAVDDDSLARAGECINDALVRIKRERPWSFLRGLAQTISLTAGTDSYDTPSGLLNVQKVYYLDTDSTPALLSKVSDADFLDRWQGQDYEYPRVYRILEMDTTNYQSRLQIAPAPSSAFISTYGSSLYLEQTDNISELTDDSSYPDLPGDFTQAIEYMAAALLCLQQGDAAQATGFTSAYATAMNVLKADDAVRYGAMMPVKPLVNMAPNSWRRTRRTDYSAETIL